MKIGFDSKRLYCNLTGLGNYSRTLVRNLQALYGNNEYYLYTSGVKKNFDTNFFADNPDFITSLYKGYFKSLWRSYSITDQLKKDRIELYHGLSHEIPFAIKKSNIKTIVTIHDLIFKIYPGTYPVFDRKIYDLKFRHSCNTADKIIAISNSTKNDIIKFYGIAPDKIAVIYQSCNPVYFTMLDTKAGKAVLKQYNIPSEYFLYVGSIEERKNLKLIIQAYKYLPDSMKIPLVVVGKGKRYQKKINELIASQEMDKLIIWIDNLEDTSHLRSIYQNAMALIYPSLYEGFGLPVAEAMLCKTPVITSCTSSLPEAGGPYSIYINPENAGELTDAMQQVLSDSQLRTDMADKGYAHAFEKFAGNKTSEQLMNLYMDVLGR